MVLMPYGDTWRRQRKLTHQVLSISNQRIFKPSQDLESKALMYELLTEPERWYLSLGRFSSSVILSVVFGIRTRNGDPNLMAIYKTQEEFVPYTMPGASIVDSFPFLAKIPFFKAAQPWRWKGDAIYNRTVKLVRLYPPLRAVVRLFNARANPCFFTPIGLSQNFLMNSNSDRKMVLRRLVS